MSATFQNPIIIKSNNFVVIKTIKNIYHKANKMNDKIIINLSNNFISFKKVPNKIIKFRTTKRNNILSEIELNNLFMGLIKLVKKSAVVEVESYATKEVKIYQDKLTRANSLIEQKNKQIKELINVIDDLLEGNNRIKKENLPKLNKKMKAKS